MAVTTCKEIHDGRAGGDSVDDQKSTVTMVRSFRVVTDTATDDSETVLAASELPGYVDAHPSYTYAYVKSRNARNESFRCGKRTNSRTV